MRACVRLSAGDRRGVGEGGMAQCGGEGSRSGSKYLVDYGLGKSLTHDGRFLRGLVGGEES